MSRIGKLPISIPAGVTITLKDNVVTVKGPKGEMSQYVNPAINVTIEDGHVTLTENDKEMLDNPKQKHAFHGLYRSLVHNMVVGVSEGYKKELELVGVGYRASNQGNIIELALGYTHNIFIQLPAEVKVETKSERNKNPLIILESCDKQLLGQVWRQDCQDVVLNFETQERYLGWQVDEETDELSVIIEDVYGFRWNSLLDLEKADYRFEDFEEFAEDYVDTSDLLKQFGK